MICIPILNIHIKPVLIHHFLPYRPSGFHLVRMGVYGKAYFSWEQIHPFLMQQFGNERYIWNKFAVWLEKQYRVRKKYCKHHHIDFSTMSAKKRKKAYKKLPKLIQAPTETKLDYYLKKLKDAYTWLKKSDSRTLQLTIKKLLHTIVMASHGKCHAPVLKSKRVYHQSYTTDSNSLNNKSFWVKCINTHLCYIKIPKLSSPVKVKFNCNVYQLEDRINQMTVTRLSTHDFKISLNIDSEKQALMLTNRGVGIDVNLKPLLALSSGQKYKNKHYYKFYDRYLRHWESVRDTRRVRANKEICKNKKYASNSHSYKGQLKLHLYQFHNYMKAQKKVAKIYHKVYNLTENRLQKISTSIVRRYDIICMENIKVSTMVHNHKLARAIEHAGWYRFRQMIKYKCAWYGKDFVLVNKNNTTRCCWFCHKNNGKMGLGVKQWTCSNPNCPFHKHSHDRDINAAINILLLGLGVLESQSVSLSNKPHCDLISHGLSHLTAYRFDGRSGTDQQPSHVIPCIYHVLR